MKTHHFYHGLEAPRMQTCVFCGAKYDAIYGAPRPHAVCEECWPKINQAEVEHRRRNEEDEQ